MTNLASSYFANNQIEKAITLQKSALAIKKRVLDPMHLYLGIAFDNLIEFYQETGRTEDLAATREELLKHRREIHLSDLSTQPGIRLRPLGKVSIPRSIEGMGFDPKTKNFLVVFANGSVEEYSTSGDLASNFLIENIHGAMPKFHCLEVLANGHLLLLSTTHAVEVTRTGETVKGGIDIDLREHLNDPEGIAYDETTRTVFVATQSGWGDRSVFQFSGEGERLFTIKLGENFGQGLTVNPGSGHLLLVENQTGTLLELTRDGDLLTRIDLGELANLDYPEAVSVDVENQILYVASVQTVAAFKIEVVESEEE